MSELPRYRPSRRSSLRLIPATLAGVVVAAALAWPYQLLISWVPYIYINLVIYIVYAGAVGAVVHMASAYGWNRNGVLGALVGIVIASAAIGASHYVAYRHAVADLPDEIRSEVTFSRYVDARVATGWSLGRRSASSTKGDITGPFVWVIWGIEAFGLLGAGLIGGISVAPYCERCKKPMRRHDLFVRRDLDLSDLGLLTDPPAAATLVDLPPRTAPPTPGLRVTYICYACPSCDSEAYLTVTSVLAAASKDGSDESKELHTHVTITRDEYNRLQALKQQLA